MALILVVVVVVVLLLLLLLLLVLEVNCCGDGKSDTTSSCCMTHSIPLRSLVKPAVSWPLGGWKPTLVEMLFGLTIYILQANGNCATF